MTWWIAIFLMTNYPAFIGPIWFASEDECRQTAVIVMANKYIDDGMSFQDPPFVCVVVTPQE